jgi:hypothetical protein
MPNYKAHLVGGASAYGIGLYLLRSCHPTATMAAEWLLCALAGSLFPDIDTKSKGQKLFFSIIFLFLLYFLLGKQRVPFMVVSLLSLTPLLVNHRGLFHRLWFVILVPVSGALLLGAAMPQYAEMALWDSFFFVLGAVSHVWLDLGVRRMMRI